MNEEMSDLPQADTADPDGVQVALRAAQTLWSRGDTAESLKWLRKAAESASDEGADLRSLQLAKAAAELRAKLFGSSEAAPARSGPQRGAAAPSEPSLAPGSATMSGAPAGESGAYPVTRLDESASPTTMISHTGLSPTGGSQVRGLAAGVEPAGEPPAAAANPDDSSAAGSSRPVTATQYPSHRPRQRMGLSSAPSGAGADGPGYSPVPSWSADAERRVSSPPPLPQISIDDYEELEAEPDEEPADDPGSIWSSSGPESWRAPEALGYPAPRSKSAVTPPPLPPRGAFSDDEGDFTEPSEPPTVVRSQPGEPDIEPRSGQDLRAGAFPPGGDWERRSPIPAWERDSNSWAGDLGGALSGSSPQEAPWDHANGLEPAPEPAPQSETARAKLTARVHHQAVRVSFAPDGRAPGQYVVRPLREGEKPAPGERIALLLALEPGVPLV